MENEVVEALPLLHSLVHRADSVSRALAEDRFSIGVRAMADDNDRRVYREFLHFAAITFLARVFGIMAVLLLVSSTGPKVTETLTLFQLFGVIFIPVCGTLTFRVLFDVSTAEEDANDALKFHVRRESNSVAPRPQFGRNPERNRELPRCAPRAWVEPLKA